MAVSHVRTMNITLLFSISSATVSAKKYTVQPAHNDTTQNMFRLQGQQRIIQMTSKAIAHNPF